MKKNVFMTLRILLGLVFLIFGTNKFFHFLPMEMADGPAKDFMMALGATGYMFYLIGLVEVVAGIRLVLNKCVPAALLLLAPVMVNIFLFHAFLDCAGFVMAGPIILIYALLVYENWAPIKPCLK
ncbi:MAG: DoxX family membrane protein [Flavobacteriaceae bacterium]|nr:DoxX family membrane protein [Flavobacteriaceae bacterium]